MGLSRVLACINCVGRVGKVREAFVDRVCAECVGSECVCDFVLWRIVPALASCVRYCRSSVERL